jgi:DNA-binding CsgD family transcriptional regulator
MNGYVRILHRRVGLSLSVGGPLKDFVGNLLRTVFESASPNDFCQHLILSVFTSFDLRGVTLVRVSNGSTIQPVGSYGEAGPLVDNKVTIWNDLPISKAISSNSVQYCAPSDQKSSVGSSLGCVCAPVRRNGLVVGALQLIFSSAPSAEVFELGLAEIAAVAAEAYFSDSSGFYRSRVASRVRRSGLPGPKSLSGANLSPRQMEVLKRLGQPLTYAEIARQVAFSESTVKKEAGRIFEFLDVYSRADAYSKALEMGLI